MTAMTRADTEHGRTFGVVFLTASPVLIAAALKTAVGAAVGALKTFGLPLYGRGGCGFKSRRRVQFPQGGCRSAAREPATGVDPSPAGLSGTRLERGARGDYDAAGDLCGRANTSRSGSPRNRSAWRSARSTR